MLMKKLMILNLFYMGLCLADVTPVASPNIDLPKLNGVAVESRDRLFQDCGKKTHKQWLKEYELAEFKILSKIKSIHDQDLNALPADSELIQTLKFLFPNLLPEGFPGRSVYADCGMKIIALENAELEFGDAVKDLELCYQKNWKKIPSLTQKLLECCKGLALPIKM